MTEREVQQAIVGNYHGCLWSPFEVLALPNASTLVGWESDIIIVQKSGAVWEVEIKCSVQDFRREFKTKLAKHQALENKFSEPGSWGQRTTNQYVQRFFFAFPESVFAKLRPDEVPAYAGIILIPEQKNSYGRFSPRIIRKAKKLKHVEGVGDDFRLKLLQLAHTRLWVHFSKGGGAFEQAQSECQSEVCDGS